MVGMRMDCSIKTISNSLYRRTPFWYQPWVSKILIKMIWCNETSNVQNEIKATNISNFLGYTIVRFKATNPGYWPFHCHAMMHNLEGMLILLRIKDPANPDRPYPPAGLPKCNSYKFDDNEYPWEKEAGILYQIYGNWLVLLVIIFGRVIRISSNIHETYWYLLFR